MSEEQTKHQCVWDTVRKGESLQRNLNSKQKKHTHFKSLEIVQAKG